MPPATPGAAPIEQSGQGNEGAVYGDTTKNLNFGIDMSIRSGIATGAPDRLGSSSNQAGQAFDIGSAKSADFGKHAIRIAPNPNTFGKDSSVPANHVPVEYQLKWEFLNRIGSTDPELENRSIRIRPLPSGTDANHVNPGLLKPLDTLCSWNINPANRVSPELLRPLHTGDDGNFRIEPGVVGDRTSYTPYGRRTDCIWNQIGENSFIRPVVPFGLNEDFRPSNAFSVTYDVEQLKKNFSIHEVPHSPNTPPTYEFPKGARVWNNGLGQIECVKTASGQIFEFAYDSNGKLNQIHEPNGSVVHKTGDRSWIRTNADGRSTRLDGDIKLDLDGTVTYDIRYELGGRTRTLWNGNGIISEVQTVPKPGFSFNEDRLLSIIDKNGNRASFHYDKEGKLDEIRYKDTEFVNNGRGWTSFQPGKNPQPMEKNAVETMLTNVSVKVDGRYVVFSPYAII